MASKSKSNPGWSDVKAKLADFDRSGLLALVKDLYGASKDNKNFIHARLEVGSDPLAPYKTIIDRWLWPDVIKNQDYSLSKAKKAVSDYKKAIGKPEGVAELSVFYCETAIGFASSIGLDDDGYYSSLIGMAEQALKAVMVLPKKQRETLLSRLEGVLMKSMSIGWGVEDALDDILHRAGSDKLEG